MQEVRLSDIIAPKFYPVYKAVRDQTHSELILKGGRASTKSSCIPIIILLGLLQDPEANAICFRKRDNRVRNSIHAKTKWAARKLNVIDDFKSITSPNEMTHLVTGQKIFFLGCDDPESIKSITTDKGYFKFLWFEEAHQFSGDAEIRNITQSVVRGGDVCYRLISYNVPKYEKHWINLYTKQLENEDSVLIHHSTYKDCPPAWLGREAILLAERLKRKNHKAYLHEYEGLSIGNPDEIVFYNDGIAKFEIKNFKTPSLDKVYQNRFFFGADWGFAQDPTVLIRCFIRDECLYIDYECYKKAVEIDHIGRVIFDKIPESKNWIIYGDSSRPETISSIRRQGYNIKSADKWQNSVNEGIEFLKSFEKIYIHSRCIRIAREFELLSYKVDKNTNEVLPIIDDKKERVKEGDDDVGTKDDGIDCVRYALCKYIKKNNPILIA